MLKKYSSSKFWLMLIICKPAHLFAAEDQFRNFDNYLALTYQYSNVQNTANFSTVGLYGETLLENNIWLSASASGLVSYDLSNNQSGFQNVYQNKSASYFSFRGGYGFNFANFINIIPYVGVNYSNILIAYNYNSEQQFIFENPSFNTSLGAIAEFNLIPHRLKFRVDNSLTYSVHKAVFPNSEADLGHVDYQNYVYNLGTELQYNISSLLSATLYYSLSSQFNGNARPPNIYYPQINTSSSNVVANDQLINSIGIRFGILF